MFLEILLAIILGVHAGTISGLIPGIHINLISASLISISPFLLTYTSPLPLAIFIIAMSITHSFLDVIPSTFLGAPDANNILLALPAHKMLLKGRAYEAIRLTVIGSLGSLIIGIMIAPILFLLLKKYYVFFEKGIFWILLTTILFLILRNKHKLKVIAILLLSGCLGFIALNLPLIKNPLLPMLSGLFGTSILINSYWDDVHIPKQFATYERISILEKSKSLIGAVIAGGLTSFLPGLGASQGAIIAQTLFKKISEKGFMIILGGINTINFTLSIIAYYAITKARNGSIIAISELIEVFTLPYCIIFLICALLAGSIATYLCLQITKVFSRVMKKISYKKMIITVIIIVTLIITIYSNIFGCILYLCSISLGLIATKIEVPKNILMGCLLIPIILYFLPF